MVLNLNYVFLTVKMEKHNMLQKNMTRKTDNLYPCNDYKHCSRVLRVGPRPIHNFSTAISSSAGVWFMNHTAKLPQPTLREKV